MRFARVLRWLLAIGLALFLLYLSLRGIQWRMVWQTLRFARPEYIAASFLLVSVALMLRGIRWRLLLLSERKIPAKLVLSANAAGQFGNNVLPARAGELVRTLMISRGAQLSTIFVLATVISERIVDAASMVLIASVLLLLPAPPPWLAPAAKPLAIAGLGGILVLALLPYFEPLIVRVIRRISASLRMKERLVRILEQALLGIRTLHDLRRLVAFVALTAVIFFFDTMNFIVVGWAVQLPLGITTALALLAGLGLGSALPSTPGYVGIFQFVAVSVLAPAGFRREEAIALILLIQALQYITFAIWGCPGYWSALRGKTPGESAGVAGSS
jgi:uncharacterized protein (TIRG00374 family)